MDIDHEPEVTPEPVTARSLGWFNIVFGVLLILTMCYETGLVLAMPAFGRLMDWGQSMQRQQLDEARKARMERFDERLKEAESDEERELIEAERTLADLNAAQIPEMMAFRMDFLDQDWLRQGVLLKFAVLGVLSGLLIASGIGLVKLRGWGRSMGRVVAVLMVPVMAGFLVGAIVSAPRLADGWTADMTEMLVGPGAGEPSPELAEAIENYRAQASRLFAYSMGMTDGLPILYPIIALIVASRPGVRAAVRRPASTS